MVLIPFLFTAALGLAANESKYESYSELAQSEKEGRDFQVRVEKRPASALVLAIHGGGIENATSELARDIAASNYSAYYFEGLKDENNWDLHITSTKFDEPRALKLVKSSDVCVSVHGFRNDFRDLVCLGGLNARLKWAVYEELTSLGLALQIELNPCGELGGKSPLNIVNRCKDHGVQLEISSRAREELMANAKLRSAFTRAVRRAIDLY